MITILICILLNVFIAVLFKYFPKYNIDAMQAIVVNYFVCVATAAFTLGDYKYLLNLGSEPWTKYAAFMGLFFFVGFNIIAKTVEHHGVLVASTSQKLSLIMPVFIALVFFKESISVYGIIGILCAIAAVLLVTFERKNNGEKMTFFIALLPLWTWLGSCFVDLSLYLVEKLNLALNAGMKFTSALFLFAGISGFIVILAKLIFFKLKLDLKSIVAGIIFGVPNFFSIYLILVILKDGWNGSVIFPLLNVGIILISALLGVTIFKEKLNFQKSIGLGLALLAIILLSFK